MNTLKMLEDYSNAFGPSGFEDDLLQVTKKHALEGLSITEDKMRNIYLHHGNKKETGKPVVQLDAHLDEVGFIVQAIQPNGLLNILPLGGWVEYTIPAHQVLIRNAEGKLIPGILATKPIHFMTEAERNSVPGISSMAIDIGASSDKEVKERYKINIAAPVAPRTAFEYDDLNHVMMGKAFDCRAGCACVVDVMNQTMDMALDVSLVGALCTQEEVGVRGAKVTAQRVKPDVAIVFEGTPADDNFAPAYMIQTALGKGPMLRHIDKGMITHPRFQRYALTMAHKLSIPVQEAVRASGQTNGAAIHLSNNGVPVIVIGIPVRYVHTHYGYASYDDYQNGVKLAIEIIKTLNSDVIEAF